MHRIILIIPILLGLSACGAVRISGVVRNGAPNSDSMVASTGNSVSRANQPATGTSGQPSGMTGNTPAANAKSAIDLQPMALAKGYTSAKDYVLDAVQSLQVGEVDSAREDLIAALKLDANSASAKILLQQIDGDAVAMLGPRNFEYEIQAGDSFSSIAKRYLGDPLRFHILAKYNGVDNPSRLNVGQKIKIPGERNIEVAKVPKPSAPVAAGTGVGALLTKARRLSDEGKYTKASELLENELDSGQLDDETPVQDVLVGVYLRWSDVLKRENKITAAQKVLQKAAIIQPTNAKVAAKMDAMRGSVTEVDKMYKDAYAAYRRQQLDVAIKGFDRVLELDPHHELAKLYRARANELKGRLDNFAAKD